MEWRGVLTTLPEGRGSPEEGPEAASAQGSPEEDSDGNDGRAPASTIAGDGTYAARRELHFTQ